MLSSILFLTFLTISHYFSFIEAYPTNTTTLILRDDSSSRKPKLIADNSAKSHLKLISQAPGKTYLGSNYVYPKASGRLYPGGTNKEDGTKIPPEYMNIFVIDSVRDLPKDLKPKFIFVSKTESHDKKKYKHDVTGHGTCVASLAVGDPWGSSKQSQLWIVKRRDKDPKDPHGKKSARDNIKAYTEILEIVRKKGLQGKAIINMSYSQAYGEGASEYMEEYEILYQLVQEGVVLVTSSGNRAGEEYEHDGKKYTISDILPYAPNIYALDKADKEGMWLGLPIIFVGSVHINGTRSSFSQGGPYLTTSAAGENVRCASNKDNKEWVPLFRDKFSASKEKIRMYGTSLSSPLVAGVIANEMSVNEGLRSYHVPRNRPSGKWKDKMYMQDTVAWKVRRWVQQNSYVRPRGNTPVIYNGYSSTEYPLG